MFVLSKAQRIAIRGPLLFLGLPVDLASKVLRALVRLRSVP
jgi:hypothetical protein